MDKYNTKIAQLAGLFTAFASEIQNDSSLKQGEKFLLLQRLFADIAPAQKKFEEVKKEIEDWAKENLTDTGNGMSQETEYEGSVVLVKYIYPKPTLDSEKLAVELERAYAEIGVEFQVNEFQKESTPRKSVIVQSKIK